MRGYGQFCPVAKAAEIVAERWTPLVLRELFCGSTRFNDLKRGVPLMSPSLLSRRLRELEQAGVVEKRQPSNARIAEYHLTDAGRELWPVIEQLGVWGKRWAQARIDAHDLDAGLLMWDIRRHIRLEQVPDERRIVVRFHLTGAASAKQRWWLVIEHRKVELCLLDPGFDVDLSVRTSLRTLTEIWLGDRDWLQTLKAGDLSLEGDRPLARGFHEWLDLSGLARVPRMK
jgi:DNA-binding HxlR family transcriptional regulator